MFSSRFRNTFLTLTKNNVFSNRFLLRNHSVYIWGYNKSLGLQPPSKGLFGTSDAIPSLVASVGDQVQQFSCGHDFCAVVKEDGSVWSWGNNKYSQLGHGDKEQKLSPTRIQNFEGIKIESVSCGTYHSAAVDANGNVYTWGWGGSFLSGGGFLGHGDNTDQLYPKLVQSLVGKKIAKVCCGSLHTIFLSEDGEIFVCGAGEEGKLGNGGTSDVGIPTPMEFFENMKVVDIKAGDNFSFAITDKKELYAWGKNDKGQIGFGIDFNIDIYKFELYPRFVEKFTNVDDIVVDAGNAFSAAIINNKEFYVWGASKFLEPHLMPGTDDKRLVKVACGNGFACVVTDQGELYTAGNSSSTCLGHEVKKGGFVYPNLMHFFRMKKVVDIGCGENYAIALVDEN